MLPSFKLSRQNARVMDLILSRTVALLVVAILVAIIARLVRLPYTVGLVITGIGLVLARVEIEATLTHDFLST